MMPFKNVMRELYRCVLGATIIFLAVTDKSHAEFIVHEEGKRQLLESYWTDTVWNQVNPAIQETSDIDEDELPSNLDCTKLSSQYEQSQRALSGVAFYGTGSTYLEVRIQHIPDKGYIGYIIDSPDGHYQDMVILEDLKSLGIGTHYVLTACSDVEKAYPRSGMRMSSSPWTSNTSYHWAYWARQAAIHGLRNGYSFDNIQASIWYITDRRGSSTTLLQNIGYPADGPSKNTNIVESGRPAPRCGTGITGAIPLMMLSLIYIKRQGFGKLYGQRA